MDNIGFIIPYVNCEDTIWKESFLKAGGVLDNDMYGGKPRYEDIGTMEALLDSIEKFAPWADIYIIVAMPSQIPNCVKNRNVKIIYHSDFLPDNLKPYVFTSNAIESFLGKMNLPEKFVWLNDDIIFTKPVLPSDFFTDDDIPKYLISFIEPKQLWSDPWVLSCYNLIFPGCAYPKRFLSLHGPTPMRRSWCEEMYKKHEKSILHSIGSIIKREQGQINQYAYSIYNYFYKKLDDNALFGISLKRIDINNLSQLLNAVSWVCINENSFDNWFDTTKALNIVKEYINNYKI